MNVHGKTVTVVGLAKSGQAAARLAHGLGADVRVTDAGLRSRLDVHFLEWIDSVGIPSEFGGHSAEMIDGSDWVVVSPGVHCDADPIRWSRERGIPVIGELEFAYRFCPCPVIAVTGSNGKTTVTTLIGRILAESGRPVFVGGNIGHPLSDEVRSLTAEHIAVLEVSSFQLETIELFQPKVAVFLNISQNHLDRHSDMEEYFEMKKQIFKNHGPDDVAVLNANDPALVALAPQLKSQVIWFNTADQIRESGIDNPNFLAALSAVSAVGVDRSCANKVFDAFHGIEHRFEVVATKNGVVFINDSKATTVESGRWALLRLNQPVVWICGGRDKGLDFRVLRDLAQSKVKAIIAVGEAAEKIDHAFSDILPVTCFRDFTQAVHVAFRTAAPGECVLLSPMCASFDMFDNFEHRGREFKRIVDQL